MAGGVGCWLLPSKKLKRMAITINKGELSHSKPSSQPFFTRKIDPDNWSKTVIVKDTNQFKMNIFSFLNLNTIIMIELD
jgi:hypothetical protein